MKKKCLLFGGAGFIGKNLATHLLSEGYDVYIYDIMVTHSYTKEELEHIHYVEKSLFQDDELDTVVANMDVIIHLVSSVGPASSMINPEKCYSQDVAKTVEILESMRRNNVNKMIFISSGGTVYGNTVCESYCEDMPLYPRNHYGVTKVTIEKILLMYNDIYGMENIILRLSNPYGAGQLSKKGIGAVTVFAEKILADEEICIWGDGNVVRDYIYIDDVVKMIGKFVEYHNNSNHEVYNIGTGVGISINELIHILEKQIGKTANVIYKQSRDIDAERNVLNMEKTIGAIGNNICYPIEKGISKYLEVLENQENYEA
ncbi:MAG: NAD-dependent epimerase/dehydratase family protein [Clostridiales bacterium]|nr:NAD-dependent epimerase/dehydratase family protein [Clostridiales bacterium]